MRIGPSQQCHPVSRRMGNFDNSPSRVKVYAFILSQPTFPDHKAICDHMGWRNLASVTGALAALYGAGYLHRAWNGKMFTYTIPAAGRADFEKWQRETAKVA